MVDRMNDRVLDMFPGDTVMYLSADSVAEVDQQSVYPTEYLNSVTLSGLPPHKLSIKLGAVIMLLRNMDTSRGHCNGTRYIVRQVSPRCITPATSDFLYRMVRLQTSSTQKCCRADTHLRI